MGNGTETESRIKPTDAFKDIEKLEKDLWEAADNWFRQLDLAPFDALIWPHPEGMGLVIPRGPWRKEPVGRLEPRPARGVAACVIRRR